MLYDGGLDVGRVRVDETYNGNDFSKLTALIKLLLDNRSAPRLNES